MNKLTRRTTHLASRTKPQAQHSASVVAPLLMAALFTTAGMLTFGTQAQTLAPQATRITDATIHTDYQTYQAVQGRIKALNEGGRRVADYHLAKAQCWLDVSFHEYSRNDRSAFPQEALSESAKLIAAMEAKQNPGNDTPLVNGADKLRDDLWAQAASLKGHTGFNCAAQKVACAEVELVHAGNEHRQQGWRHAKPYVQIAEDMLGEAKAAAEACNPPRPAPAPAPYIAPALAPAPYIAPAPAAVTAERITLAADALFKFDKSSQVDMLPAGKQKLDELVARLNGVYARVDEISIVGYTDRLNTEAYNQKLSEARANTVKTYLRNKGVSVNMNAYGRGKENQVIACTEHKETRPRTKALTDCLQPNRRVEIMVSGIKR